jgi:D-alanyl-D-alanine carboxypeptidase
MSSARPGGAMIPSRETARQFASCESACGPGCSRRLNRLDSSVHWSRNRPAQISTAAAFAALLAVLVARSASAEALLLVDAGNGKVLHAENATYPWYPASVTKLMTAYVTLHAVQEGRITLDTLINVSDNAVAQQPTKMGFRAGTQVTVDNALKMMMVKSANDMAVALAEAVGGSIDNFAAEMNHAAQRLGMTQSSFVNPNGLPDENQMTSARDLAILARALIREFPEYDFYWHIPAIKLGKRVMRNYNTLIDRYPGADGMKTGFICSAGFNLVATATRGNKRLIAVVLGAPSSSVRAMQAAQLLEKGFNTSPLSWLLPSLGAVDQLTPIAASPPDLHDATCGKHRRRPAAETEEEAVGTPDDADTASAYAAMHQSLRAQKVVLGPWIPSMPPVEVYVGANKPRPRPVVAHSGASGDGAAPAPAKKPAAKPAAAKPAAAKPAVAKKPSTAAAPTAAKPQPRPGS